MLEEILHESLSKINATNQKMFGEEGEYQEILNKKQECLGQWKSMNIEDQAIFNSLDAYEKSKNIPDPRNDNFIPAKNTYLLRNEIQKRISREDPISLLAIEPLDFDDATLELAESLENIAEIQELYRIRKAATGVSKNSGIPTTEAAKLKNCFGQGRELYLAGRNGSLMVKPLNFFYALTAYTYGIIILNNPLRYRKDMLPGSHGMTYLPTTIQAQFGGDSPRGTFSDLVGAFPTQLVKKHGISFNLDCSESIKSLYEIRNIVSLGTLLSLVPEMSDYFKLTTGKESRCYPLEIVPSGNFRDVIWEFQIGNGEKRPPSESIVNAFFGFSVSERHGKTVISVPAFNSSNLKATIYTDIRGNLWFIDNPFFPIILPETAIHFLVTSIFSNIMRYRPDEWGNVLSNEVSSSISLLTRHYFSSFQRKFMLLILRSLSRYLPYTT